MINNIEQFLVLFLSYQSDIGPMQILAYVFGFSVLLLGLGKFKWAEQIGSIILVAFWIWTAWMFWFPAGQKGFKICYVMMILFLIEGGLIFFPVIRPEISPVVDSQNHKAIGIVLIVYAVIGYPLVSFLFDRTHPLVPLFGLTANTLVVFTLGLFLLSNHGIPLLASIIPVLYGLGVIIWVLKGYWADISLFLSSLVYLFLIYQHYQQKIASNGSEDRPSESRGWSLNLSEDEKD